MFDFIFLLDTEEISKVATPQVESVWSVLAKGGVLMIPLMG